MYVCMYAHSSPMCVNIPCTALPPYGHMHTQCIQHCNMCKYILYSTVTRYVHVHVYTVSITVLHWPGEFRIILRTVTKCSVMEPYWAALVPAKCRSSSCSRLCSGCYYVHHGTIYNNNGTVYNNNGTVYNHNNGTIYNNNGTVYNHNNGTIYNNNGTVYNNNTGTSEVRVSQLAQAWERVVLEYQLQNRVENLADASLSSPWRRPEHLVETSARFSTVLKLVFKNYPF